MLNKRVVEIGAWRNFDQHPQVNLCRDIPDVPVLPETLLLMEFCSNGSSIDLHEMTQFVLGDLGATIQVIRQAGQECSFAEDRPNRIEDYISTLGVHSFLEAASRQTVTRCMNKPAILKAWLHARAIAENCKSAAEEIPWDLNPDEAYLAGLLHELGTLPAILGWDPALALSCDPDLAGLRLAEAWSLPRCVVEYFREIRNLKGTNRWTGLVRRAHEMSNFSPVERSFEHKPEFQVAECGQLQAASS